MRDDKEPRHDWGRSEQGLVCRLPTARRDGPGPGWQNEGPTEDSSVPDSGGRE